MNQRIIKLIGQALREIESIPVEQVTASRIDDYGIVEIPNTFGEKLAELIVKECIKCCIVAEVNYAINGEIEEADGAIGAKELIVGYFGVE